MYIYIYIYIYIQLYIIPLFCVGLHGEVKPILGISSSEAMDSGT